MSEENTQNQWDLRAEMIQRAKETGGCSDPLHISVEAAIKVAKDHAGRHVEMIRQFCIGNHTHYPEYVDEEDRYYPDPKGDPYAGQPITANAELFKFMEEKLGK